VDVTLCESLLSIEDKSAILYCSWSQHGFYMKYHLYLSKNTCQYQDEIQAANWSQQVTLFTVAIWAKGSASNTTCNSHVIVSDDLSHDKK